MPKKIVVVVVAFIVLLMSSIGLAEEPRQGGALILGTIGDADVINPVLAKTKTGDTYSRLIYESLMEIDPITMEPVLGPLAENFEVLDGNRLWTFFLKRGVTFSDGHEFDAEDVEYTYQILTDPNTNTVRGYMMDQVTKINVLDRYTIQFVLKAPYPGFLTSTLAGMRILPAHLFKGTDINTNSYNHQPVGTGPFVLKEWVHDSHAIFEAREDYHRDRAYLDRVVYKVVSNSNSLLAAAEAGDVDFAPVPASEVKRLNTTAEKNGLKLYSREDFAYSYVAFNLQKELFKDVQVRKALALAVYKPAIIEVAYFNQGQPATANIVPGIGWAYNPNIPAYEYDLEEARRLLEEAGWKKGVDGIREKDGQKLTFTLSTNKGSVGRERTQRLLQAFWKKIGVEAKIDSIPYVPFITDHVQNKKFDAIVLSWTGMGPDPDDYTLFHSSQIENGFNICSYSNPEVDELLVKGRTTMSVEVRQPIYYRIQEIIHDDYPYIFLMYTKGNGVFNKKVRGIQPSPLGYISDWTKVWIAE